MVFVRNLNFMQQQYKRCTTMSSVASSTDTVKCEARKVEREL